MSARDPRPLGISAFGAGDPLSQHEGLRQVQYLRRYLDDLEAKTVLEEPYYFDRDYLAEFAAFYCASATGYPNVCRRLHFFSAQIDRSQLESAIGGDELAVATLKQSYLGFVVVRPIPATPIGRTVLAWYPDRERLTLPRITGPSRRYACHVAGLTLTVAGLAWQQQDSAVGACATIALWSMLHASALDGHHGVPTTASVTRAAHKTASMGSRVFPSDGLTIYQLCEAMKEHSLQPVVIPGDIAGSPSSFSREKFAASCSALIRSGFPVLVTGLLRQGTHVVGAHAVCAVGFRSAAPPTAPPGDCVHHDQDIPLVYVHDDNIGPNVRLAVATDATGAVVLKPDAPIPPRPPRFPDPLTAYPEIVPSNLVVAVPEDLRTSPDSLHEKGLQFAKLLSGVMHHVFEEEPKVPHEGLTLSTRFSRLDSYLGEELAGVLPDPNVRARARLALVEEVPPMSRYVGVVRVGDGATPLFDLLTDTTDSEHNRPIFAHVLFESALVPFLDVISQVFDVKLGKRVVAR